MRVLRMLVATLAVTALLATGVSAQELRGRITGVVTDDSGAIVPGVTVTAASPALIQPQTTVSGSDGNYRFPALPSGLYTLTFELQGFQTLKREGVRVTLNQTFTIDAKLKPATLNETMTITADTPTVDTKTTSIGTAFTKELRQRPRPRCHLHQGTAHRHPERARCVGRHGSGPRLPDDRV